MNNSADRRVIFHIDMNFTSLRPEYLRAWLKRIADMGYNAILWEVEDKVEWETCQECVHPDAMSKSEFKELLSYSRELGLEPIPLLQTFGHAEYVLIHDKYRAFRENAELHDCYCSSNPDVKTFLKQWISEYLELFGDINHFHLGGDEAYVFGTCPTCRETIEQSSANELYATHLMDICGEILEKGINPGIWGDMLLHYPQDIDKIPSCFIIWDWNYWDGIDSPEKTKPAGKVEFHSVDDLTEQDKLFTPEILDDNGKLVPFYTADFLVRSGREVILCSSSRSAGDSFFLPVFEDHIVNIIGASQKAAKLNLLGTCVTSWAIRVNSLEVQAPLIELGPKAFEAPDATRDELIDLVDGSIMNSAPNQHTEMNLLLNTFSAIQHNTLKDSTPAPVNHMSDRMEGYANPSDPWNNLWNERFELIKSIIEKSKESLELVSRSQSDFAVQLKEGIELQLSYSEAMELIINNSLAEAEIVLTALKQKFSDYLKDSQSDRSAEHNSSLVFDPLIEYCGS